MISVSSLRKIDNKVDARLLKNRRLLKPDEFSHVFKKPIRSSDRYLTILAVRAVAEKGEKTDSQLNARLGLAISKKNAKRAVDRNRIKRLIRESFRLHLVELPAIDIVVMAKPVAKNAKNQQIFHSLQQHWIKLAKELR